MICPTLQELPPPPPGKTGWPWTEESEQHPDPMPGNNPSRRISIVTPSFNQSQFIEETIRSVLLQGYADLEYIIIDGGSTDQSTEIIKKYEPWLTFWVSEHDRGQSHAINKGFSHATGDIYAYLNSDDILYPGVLAGITPYFMKDKANVLVCCSGRYFGPAVHTILGLSDAGDPRGERLWAPRTKPRLTDWLTTYESLLQQSTFWSNRLHSSIGGFSEDLDFCFDKAFFLQAIFRFGAYTPCPKIVAAGHRLHESCKTMQIPQVMAKENQQLRQQYQDVEWCRNLINREARAAQADRLLADVLERDSFLVRIGALIKVIQLDPSMLSRRAYWGAVRRIFGLPRLC